MPERPRDPAGPFLKGAADVGQHKTKSSDGDDQKLFFDESVPVETIKVPNPKLEGLREDEYEVIGQKESFRLAQVTSTYVILKYVRDVIKLKAAPEDEPKITCPAVPDSVFEKSHADVSFLVGMLIDKFQYHLPLHRQYLRLQAAGIGVSRPWLTQLVHRCGNLLEPIFEALDLIRPLWKIEREIKKQGLTGDQKMIYRVLHSKPIVDEFFKWVKERQKEKALLPSNLLTKALSYVEKREAALRLFLTAPEIPIDTSEIERALRPIPMGRKNWLF